jgi:hypothetical protein
MAEASWFEQAPAQIKPFLAPYICRLDGNGDLAPSGYQLEYLHLAALNELYVFGRLPERVWRRIFHACDAYLRTASSLAPTALESMFFSDWARLTYLDKTLQRLDAYAGQADVDLDAPWTLNGRAAPSLRAIAHEAAAAMLAVPPAPCFLHGDFCFSNILFDFRAGRVKTIDPRGTDALGRPSRFGDLRYDLAKLAHSVLGSTTSSSPASTCCRWTDNTWHSGCCPSAACRCSACSSTRLSPAASRPSGSAIRRWCCCSCRCFPCMRTTRGASRR